MDNYRIPRHQNRKAAGQAAGFPCSLSDGYPKLPSRGFKRE